MPENDASVNLTRRQAADLIDTLRRCAELLDMPGPVSMLAPGWYEERDYIVRVAQRLVREYDPEHITDLAVTNPGEGFNAR